VGFVIANDVLAIGQSGFGQSELSKGGPIRQVSDVRLGYTPPRHQSQLPLRSMDPFHNDTTLFPYIGFCPGFQYDQFDEFRELSAA
jgi:hypothetical protein